LIYVHNIVPVGNSATVAIAVGAAATAALIFAAPVIAFLWWGKKKPQDHFFDVPG
jgi:hypothetical protein